MCSNTVSTKRRRAVKDKPNKPNQVGWTKQITENVVALRKAARAE